MLTRDLLAEEGIMAMNIVILISSLIIAAGVVIAVVLKKDWSGKNNRRA